MKTNKGITMLSLVVYVAVFLVVIAVVANISSFFYKDITTMDAETTSDYEYNKLNLYLLEETKKTGNEIVSVNSDYVEFSSGNIFKKQSNKIYFIEQSNDTKMLLCDNVEELKFEKATENGKNILKMNITLTSFDNRNSNDTRKTTSYNTNYVVNYSNEYNVTQDKNEYIVK